MIKKKKEGFSLVELLAVIAILAVVAGFTIYVAINVINSSKEKKYTIAINEVEKNAGSYLMENADRLFYLTDINNSNVEYQCLTVENLINYGYFKSDILKSQVSNNKTISENDYVYIERDKTTKTITKSRYILNDEELMNVCNVAVRATGDISIDVEPSGLSGYKDITIIYRVKNANNINDYNYTYSYSNNEVVTEINSGSMLKKIRVTDDGTISANIIYTKDNSSIFSISKNITDIDKTPPVITINSDLKKVYGEEFDLYEGVTITDNSGVVADKKIYLNGSEITSYSELLVGENIVTYSATDKFGNEATANRKITLVVADKEFNYKEEDQIYQVEADGTYIISAYGAQGGNSGGLGGYVKVEIPLKKGDTLIINTGGVNGYNGGGAYGNSKYKPGGGATTIKYNNNYVVIAAGGGAKGNSGTPGDGGNGTGAGGSSVGSGAGKSGSNGGGGSNSLNYTETEYKTCCYTCTHCDKVQVCAHQGNMDSLEGERCWKEERNCVTGSNCSICGSYSCNKEVTKSGKSGSGGSNNVVSPAVTVENVSGNRSGNGYVKIAYKLGG